MNSNPPASDFLVSQVRILDMAEMRFFYTANQPIKFEGLDRNLDALLESLYAAKKQANLGETGPDIVRYHPITTGGEILYRMEVGIAVKPDIFPAGEAQVKTLPPYHCASVLLWGGLTHTVEAYTALKNFMRETGLVETGECREVNYFFESVESPNNLMGVFMEIAGE